MIQLAPVKSRNPEEARSSWAKLSLTAHGRDSDPAASTSGTVTCGLRVMTFG
jgi:hypothetical protein